MRWIEVVQRFAEDKPAKGGGICTYHYPRHYRDVVKVDGTTTYYYHDHDIAIKNSNKLTISHCGHVTYTTAIRLNAIIKQFFPEYTIHRLFCDAHVYMILSTKDKMYSFDTITLDKKGKVIGGDYSEIMIIDKIGRRRINEFDDYITVKADKTYVQRKKDGKWFEVIGKKKYGYVCKELKNFTLSIIN